MFNSNGGYSLSDIAAVTDGNGSNSGWDNGNDWWIILLFLFAFGGWGGRGGFGGGYGNGGSGNPVTRGELDYSNLDVSMQ